MRGFAFLVLLLAPGFAFAQNPAPQQEQQVPPAPAAAAQPVAPEVADAEAAIVKSDWSAAETKLTPWVATHPNDARALFDAGYVADEQNRLDDAAGLYRRAVEANPQSFEARLSLGLLLARQGKL
ncbi:MAG: tetratricopeptide repeat protein, partial [Terracidiphilus sp.]